MGKRFRFIHCADLHLGMPIAQAGGGAHWDQALREATIRAFENIVDAAIEKKVDALLIAGDVYQAADHSLAAQLAFARELFRASEAGIRAFIVHGNHDPVDAWRAKVPLPPTAVVFGSEEVEAKPLVVDGETAAMVYGRSYAATHVREDWASLYERTDDAPYAIALLHTEGPTGDGGNYAPTSMEVLARSRMNYWALGHVHTRTVLGEEPYIVYPGNTQSLHRHETGPRGCYLVEVGSHGTTMMEFIETDAVRRELWEIAIDGIADTEALVALLTERRKERRDAVRKPILVTVRFTGRGALHEVLRDEDARTALMERLNEQEYYKHIFVCWDRTEDKTQPLTDWTRRAELPDATGAYLRAHAALTDELGAIPAETLRAWLQDIPEWTKYARYLTDVDDTRLQAAWEAARSHGAERLLGDDDYEAE